MNDRVQSVAQYSVAAMHKCHRRRSVFHILSLIFLVCGAFSIISLRSIISSFISYNTSHPAPSRPINSPTPVASQGRRLVIVSLSYHESPVQDLRELLGPLGVEFIEKGINNYCCTYFNSCRNAATRHDELLRQIIMQAGQLTAQWFHSQFRDDSDWRRADAFLCYMPAATCEYFVHFNKPIIVWTVVRLIDNRRTEESRLRWYDTFKTSIATNPRNVVASNNVYDAALTRFLTGVDSVLLPSYCGYVRTTYNPTRAGFLIYRSRHHGGFTQSFVDGWNRANQLLNVSRPVQLTVVHELYRRHSLADLAAHRGVVSLPHQPSMMCVFEQYQMGVPLFFPSLELLVKWQMNPADKILSDVNIYYGDITSKSFQPVVSQSNVPHPNHYGEDNVAYWLNMSDWYYFPYIYYYDSFEHLAKLLNNITDDELRRTSDKMKLHNLNLRKELQIKWKNELIKVIGNNSDIVLNSID